MIEATMPHADLLSLTTDIVTAHVANNSISLADLPTLIASVHAALAGLGGESPAPAAALIPAVPIRASVRPDYIVCLEDGARLKMLKRYIRTRFNLTPAEYRAKWQLPADYPMVAPNYAEMRRTMARTIGLGRKPAAPAPEAKPDKQPRARRKLSIASTD